MKIFIPKPHEIFVSNNKKSEWILDRIIDEFCEKTSHQIVYNPNDADIIWFYAKFLHDRFPKNLLKKKFVITTFHHCVLDVEYNNVFYPAKFSPKEMEILNEFTNVYHVPNKKTLNVIQELTDNSVQLLHYWVNNDLFYPDETFKKSKNFFNIPENKVVIFSGVRDTEGSNPSIPKIEKGGPVFIDIIKNLNKEKYHILLSGVRRTYVINELNKINFPYTYIEMHQNMNELYNLSDYYLGTSFFEGGAQFCLEAPATKTKIICSNAGLADEILSQECIFEIDSEKKFISDVVLRFEDAKINDHVVEKNFARIQDFYLDKMIKRYDQWIEKIYGER